MHGFLTGFHLLTCFALVVSVLLQSGKGGGLAGAFGGGGGAQTLFGGRGAAGFLSKATTVLGALFLLSALLLAVVPRGQVAPTKSLIQEEARGTQATQPTTSPEGVPPMEGFAPSEGVVPEGGTATPAQGTQGEGERTTPQETQPAPSGGGTEEPQGKSGGGQ